MSTSAAAAATSSHTKDSKDSKSSTDAKAKPLRIFMTGASGYIGSVIIEKAVAAGHTVYGLSRSESSDAHLKKIGCVAVRGDLTSLEVLKRQATEADAIIHLAFALDFGNIDFEKAVATEIAAVTAMAEPFRGTQKPLIMTGGSALAHPDPNGAETTEESPISQDFVASRVRSKSEAHILALANGDPKTAVRTMCIRLAPYVYGRCGSGLKMFVQFAAREGESLYIGDGGSRTTDVHVDDAADLYLLAMTNGRAGQAYNATAGTTVTQRQMADVIGESLDIPVRSIAVKDAEVRWGPFLTAFRMWENRASNAKARKEFGWKPTRADLLTDLRTGSYREMAAQLKADLAANKPPKK